jgi:excisionase family DNA binding protein
MEADRCAWRRTGNDAEVRQITSMCMRTRYRARVTEPADSQHTDVQTPAVGAVVSEAFPPILTTAQAAELLHVHVEYLRKMVREERIPAHRFPGGREIRFVRDELIAWVREQPGHDRSPSAEERAEH